MRYVRARNAAAAFVVIAIATALAVATRGNAASGNICNSPSVGTPLSAASCVKQFVLPHYVTAGSTVLSVTKFFNQSGSGGATATHVVVAVDFGAAATSITSIQVSVNATSLDPSICTTQTSAGAPVGVSCPVGNIAGGGSAKLVVQYVTSHGGQLTGSASYGEGGGNPSNPPNDFQVNYDTLNVIGDGSASGSCFAIPWSVTGSTAKQSTAASGNPLTDGSFPCTFADAGVFSTAPPFAGTPTTQVSFVEFPVLPSMATVVIKFTPLPAPLKWQSFPLNENNGGANFVVPNCNKDGSVPAGDSCIYNRSTLPKGGAEIDLHVTGSPADGSYWG
jgi:hypothetical protein